jgi:hypothetical protein
VTLYERVEPSGSDRIAHDFPVGTVFIHEAVNREEGHGVAVKRSDHTDEYNGSSWWYGKIFDDGTDDTNTCNPCGSCHTRPETDFVWGVPVSALR